MEGTLKQLQKQLKEKRQQIKTTQEKLILLEQEEKEILQITELVLQLKAKKDPTTSTTTQTQEGQIPQEEATQIVLIIDVVITLVVDSRATLVMIVQSSDTREIR